MMGKNVENLEGKDRERISLGNQGIRTWYVGMEV
jgi:hypothetical protein